MQGRIVDYIFELKSGCCIKEDKIRKSLKLSPSEFRAILTLTPCVSVSCNTLSKKMGLSFSRGSRVIYKLLKNGYLEEKKSDKDRRILYITLTNKGEKVKQKIDSMLEECEKIFLKKISSTDRKKFAVYLRTASEIFTGG